MGYIFFHSIMENIGCFDVNYDIQNSNGYLDQDNYLDLERNVDYHDL